MLGPHLACKWAHLVFALIIISSLGGRAAVDDDEANVEAGQGSNAGSVGG